MFKKLHLFQTFQDWWATGMSPLKFYKASMTSSRRLCPWMPTSLQLVQIIFTTTIAIRIWLIYGSPFKIIVQKAFTFRVLRPINNSPHQTSHVSLHNKTRRQIAYRTLFCVCSGSMRAIYQRTCS
jgi:hypothetical protein